MTQNKSKDLAKSFIQNFKHVSFPNSNKKYISGEIYPNIRVGMREIKLSDTLIGGTKNSPVYEPNESIYVYDTSGYYSDLKKEINIYSGLEKIRDSWIETRDDIDYIDGTDSEYTKKREEDITLKEIRFQSNHRIKKGQKNKVVTQMHYARRGIVTPEMEYIAVRENLGLKKYKNELLNIKHSGNSFGGNIPEK